MPATAGTHAELLVCAIITPVINHVEFTHASTNARVLARVWRRHNELLGAAVMEKASPLRYHKLLRAIIRHVVHDKRRGGPLQKSGGGLPE